MVIQFWFKSPGEGQRQLGISSFYLERAVLHQYHILEGTRIRILLPQRQKWEGFVREVHWNAHKIHITFLQLTSTVQVLYHDSDCMENATNCFLGVVIEVIPVGKAKRLAGAPQLLLLMHTLRAPQVMLWGQSLQEVYITSSGQGGWITT